MNRRVRPEVAGPTTGSVKSGADLEACVPLPDFAALIRGYGTMR
jgi:hypothetical protein